MKKTLNSQINLEKENDTRRVILPYVKMYHKTIVMKTVQCQHENNHRPMEQNSLPRHKYMHIQSTNLQGRAENSQWQRIVKVSAGHTKQQNERATYRVGGNICKLCI